MILASSILSAHPALAAWGEGVGTAVAGALFWKAARYARPHYDEVNHPNRRASDTAEQDIEKRNAELVEALRLAQKRVKPPGRVVIVEDAETVRMVLQALLEQAGIQTRVAGSVAEVFPFVAPDDVLVSDWYLPDGTALDVVEKFHEVYPGAPVVLISALDSKPANLPPGAIWMSKPFDPDQFISIVRRLLERKLGA